nr:Fe(3+) dicitrate ABC transporter substrate-binding protein [Paenibacillus pinihumi]
MRYHHNKVLSFLIIGVIALALSACGSTATNTSGGESTSSQSSPNTSSAADTSTAAVSGPIEIKHELGTIKLDKVPQRIVVMEFSYTDALIKLGVHPIGVADDSDPALFMDAVREKLGDYTSIGSRYEPNIELISSLQPDLIIADLNHHKSVYDQLNGIAPTLVLNDHQADYNGMLSNFSVIAKAVGKEAESKQLIQEHEGKIKALQEKIVNRDLTVLPAVVNPKGFFAHSSHSYSGSFITALGFKDPVTDEVPYPQLSLEQLVETNPQVLFLLPAGDKTIVGEWEKNPLWQKIDAVKNNRVFTVDRKDWALSRGLIGSEKIVDDIVKYLGE